MPELPEVETTLRGISKRIINKKIESFKSRTQKLRWPIDRGLSRYLKNKIIISAWRRGKYIIFNLSEGHLLIHLGMSGKLRVFDGQVTPKKHEHWDLSFTDGWTLRYTDIRKFGALVKIKEKPEEHNLLKNLGPEPLGNEFNSEYLFQCTRKRTRPIKNLIMDANVVTGVGNIYANEALFLAGIRPRKQSRRLTKLNCEDLVSAIRQTLQEAIEAGGTTLKDYTNADEAPGYFKKKLRVYDRGNKPCLTCGTQLKIIRQTNRQTVYCPSCQK